MIAPGFNRYSEPFHTGYGVPNYGNRVANIGGLFGGAYRTGTFGLPYAGYGGVFPSNYTGLYGRGYGANYGGVGGVSPYLRASPYGNERYIETGPIGEGYGTGYSAGLHQCTPVVYPGLNQGQRYGGYGLYRGLI